MPAPRAVLYDVHHKGLKIHVPHTKISASGMLKSGAPVDELDEVIVTQIVVPPPTPVYVPVEVPVVEPIVTQAIEEPVVAEQIVQEPAPVIDDPAPEQTPEVTNDDADKKVVKKKFGRK
jgi:hypothetical protein